MQREVRLLVASAGASRVGDSMSSVALAIVVYHRSHSPAWVAASAVARIVPYLVLSPAGAAVAERFGFRRVMVASDLTSAVLLLAIASLAAGAAPVAVVVAVAAVASAIGVPFRPAQLALTPMLSGADRLAGTNAALAAVDNISLVVGPAAAAGLFALGSASGAFVFDAATFLVSAACLAAIPTMVGRCPHPPHHAGDGRDQARGARAVTGSGPAAGLIAAIGVATLVYGVECVLFLMVAQDQLATGPSGVGFLHAAVGIGGLLATGLAARLARHDGPGAATTVRVSLAASGAALVVLAATNSLAVACVLLAIDGAAGVVLEVADITTLQRQLTPEVTARVTGVMNTVVAATFMAGFVIAPVLVAALGVRGALVVGGGLLIISATVLRCRSVSMAPAPSLRCGRAGSEVRDAGLILETE
jgi:MFS family permease